MFEWQKQAEAVVNNWNETQKQMWESWSKNMVPTFDTEAWGNAVEMWQGSVKTMMDTQAQWTQTWVDSVTANENVPAQFTEFVQKSQEMQAELVALQTKMWENWFAMLKNVEPGKMPEGLTENMNEMVQVWQQSVQKMVDAQNEWFQNVSAQIAKAQDA